MQFFTSETFIFLQYYLNYYHKVFSQRFGHCRRLKQHEKCLMKPLSCFLMGADILDSKRGHVNKDVVNLNCQINNSANCDK